MEREAPTVGAKLSNAWRTVATGDMPRVETPASDLVCWPFLEGRRCVRHAELATAESYQVAIVPIPPSKQVRTCQTKSVGSDVSSSTRDAAEPQLPQKQPAVLDASKDAVEDYARRIQQLLRPGLAAVLDDSRSTTPGHKFHTWERLGVPLRVEVGHREAAAGTATVALNPGLVQLLKAAGSSTWAQHCPLPGLLQQLAVSPTQHQQPQQLQESREVQQQPAQQHPTQLAAADAVQVGSAVRSPSCLDQQGPLAAAAAAAAAATAAAAQAACVYGEQPLKLKDVPAADILTVCQQVLTAAAAAAAAGHIAGHQVTGGECHEDGVSPSSSSSSSNNKPGTEVDSSSSRLPRPGWLHRLLPYGCCSKLHLWQHVVPPEVRPCVHHLQHLLGTALPCHCTAAPHVDLHTLRAEVLQQMQLAGYQQQVSYPDPKGASSTAGAAAAGRGGCSEASSEVGLFLWGLPAHWPVHAARQALLAAAQQLLQPSAALHTASARGSCSSSWGAGAGAGAAAPAPAGDSGTVGGVSATAGPCRSSELRAPGVSATVASRGNGKRCRGWAKMMLPDLATATAVMQQLQGQLVLRLPEQAAAAAAAAAAGDGVSAETDWAPPHSSSDISSSTGHTGCSSCPSSSRVAADTTNSSSSRSPGSSNHTAVLEVSWCCGRADALFPCLPFCCRRALRLDSVAAYSATDLPAALSMSSLLAHLAALARPQQQQQPRQHLLHTEHHVKQPSNGGSCTPSRLSEQQLAQPRPHQQQSRQRGLSVTDLTACAGGNVAAFLHDFDAVTAVELDRDRAEDLLHNVRVVLGLHHEHRAETCSSTSSSSTAAGGSWQSGFDPLAVPYLAVLEQQGPAEGQPVAAACRCCGVVCGNAALLAEHLQQQDVVFLDPPWGGPNYMQQQQQLGQQASSAPPDSQPSAEATMLHQTNGQQPATSISSDVAASASAAARPACGPGYLVAGMTLGGVLMSDLCVLLARKCAVVAIRVPSRSADVKQFAQAVVGQLTGSAAPRTAVVARYGRSSLVVFAALAAERLLQQLQGTVGRSVALSVLASSS